MLDFLPYIVLVLLLFAGSLLEVSGFRKDQVKIVRYFILAFLLLFVGLRYNTGADWGLYTRAFENVDSMGNIMKWEPAFYGLMKLIRLLFGNYYVLQFGATFFFLYAINKCYTAYSSYPILAISLVTILFFTSILMAQVRQSMALSVILLGTPYIFKRDFVKFLLIIVLASLFHITAIIALPLYFLSRRINNVIILLILLFSQVLYFYPELIFACIKGIAPILPQRMQDLVEIYIDTIYAEGTDFGSGYLLYLLTTLLYSVCVLITNRYSKHEKAHFFANALLVATIFFSLTNVFTILVRFLPYFYVFGILAFVNMIEIKYKQIALGSSKFLCVCVLFIFLMYPMARYIQATASGNELREDERSYYVPYYNVLNYPPEADNR